jgi:antitoxin HicB
MARLQICVSQRWNYAVVPTAGDATMGDMSTHRSYTIQLRPEPEGGFTVFVPALPEVVTYGLDEEEALAMAREAIELALEVRREDGEEIPADIVPLTRTINIAA